MPPETHDPLPAGTLCVKCGYDLRGLTRVNCPECGDDLTYARGGASVIPWLHRRQRGWLLAYWQTVALVLGNPGLLAREMYRPVSYGDRSA